MALHIVYTFFYILNGLYYSLISFLPVVFTIAYIWISSNFSNHEYSIFHFASIGYLVLYSCGAIYIAGAVGSVHRYRKSLEKYDFIHFTGIVIAVVISIILQRNSPYVRVMCFAVAMSCMDLSFYIQRPEDLYYPDLRVFNFRGFKMIVDYLFTIKKKFYVISIVMDDASFYESALGKKERENLEACIISGLKQKFKNHCSIFKSNYGHYEVIIRDYKGVNLAKSIEYIKAQIGLRWGFSSIDLDLSFRICSMESYNDVKSISEITDLIDYFSINKKFKAKYLQANSLDLSKLHSKSYLERAIYDGLKYNRFEVYYQPLYSAIDHKLSGAEALLRLRDNEGNFVSPEDFIPIAEQNGTIFEIGKFVFESVCKTLSEIKLEDYQ